MFNIHHAREAGFGGERHTRGGVGVIDILSVSGGGHRVDHTLCVVPLTGN